MINFRSLIKKCPLKIHLTIWWEWNYKSKKKRLKEALEQIQNSQLIINQLRREIATKTYIHQENERIEKEAKINE